MTLELESSQITCQNNFRVVNCDYKVFIRLTTSTISILYVQKPLTKEKPLRRRAVIAFYFSSTKISDDHLDLAVAREEKCALSKCWRKSMIKVDLQ